MIITTKVNSPIPKRWTLKFSVSHAVNHGSTRKLFLKEDEYHKTIICVRRRFTIVMSVTKRRLELVVYCLSSLVQLWFSGILHDHEILYLIVDEFLIYTWRSTIEKLNWYESNFCKIAVFFLCCTSAVKFQR